MNGKKIKKLNKHDTFYSKTDSVIDTVNALIDAYAGLEREVEELKDRKIYISGKNVDEVELVSGPHVTYVVNEKKPESTVCEEPKPTTITESVKEVLRNVKFEKLSVTNGCREILRLFGADLNHFMPDDKEPEKHVCIFVDCPHKKPSLHDQIVYILRDAFQNEKGWNEVADEIVRLVRSTPSEKL